MFVVLYGKKVFLAAAHPHLLTQITPPTKSRVEFWSTDDHLLIMWTRMSMRKDPGRSVGTSMAKCSELLNRISKRDTLKQVALKGTSVGVSIESHKVEMPSMCIHYPFHKRHEVTKKLCLINDDNSEAEDVLEGNVIQIANRDTRSPLVVVSYDFVATVANIAGMFHYEHGSIESGVTGKNTQNARGLPRKHRT
jgi:hypothetical protein